MKVKRTRKYQCLGPQFIDTRDQNHTEKQKFPSLKTDPTLTSWRNKTKMDRCFHCASFEMRMEDNLCSKKEENYKEDFF